MHLPEKMTPLATGSSMDMSDWAVPAYCTYPVSGQYGPGVRILYYVLVTICIFAGRVKWMRGASLAAALVLPAVAAIHALIISCVSHSNGVVDLDIFGIFQLCAIGVLCAPITVKYSRTASNIKGRNIVFVWTALNLAGLLSLIVTFHRAVPIPCIDNAHNNVTLATFWSSQSNNPQSVCVSPDPENSRATQTVIREDPSNPSQWIPAPHLGMTLKTAALMCVACCILAILSLVSLWQKIVHISWRKKWLHHGNDGGVNDVGSCQSFVELPKSMSSNEEKAIRENQAKTEWWMEDWIRLVFGLVERIVFSVCAIAITVLGELNFWSREMRSGVEPITSIGQWGPIVGAAFTLLGSLFCVLTSKDDDKGSKYSGDSSDRRAGIGAVAVNHALVGPTEASASESAPGAVQKTEQAHFDDITSGHRLKVNESIFKLLKAWGTPGADRFCDGIAPGVYFFCLEIPGEPGKNPKLQEQADEFERRGPRRRSESMNTMPSGRASLNHTDAGGVYSLANESRYRSGHLQGSTSGSSLNVPDRRFSQELNHSPYWNASVTGPSSSSPTASASPSSLAFPSPVRPRTCVFLTVPSHQETLPPREHRTDTLTTDAIYRRPSSPIPAINIVCADSSSIIC